MSRNLRAIRTQPDPTEGGDNFPDPAPIASTASDPAAPAPLDSDHSQDDGNSGGDDFPDKPPVLEGVYDSVSDTKPDEAAKIIGLSKSMGQPPSFVANNLPAAEKAGTVPPTSFFAQLESQYPGTTQFLSNPRNMAVTHDDIPNVAQHEELAQHAQVAMSLLDAIQAGYQGSSLGLDLRGKLPDMTLPQHAPLLYTLASGAAQMLSEAPDMAIGGLVGAGAGALAGSMAAPGAGTVAGATIGGLAGPFAYPAAKRTYLRQTYEQGDLQDSDTPVGRIAEILKEATKQGIVGIATGGAGMAAGSAFAPVAVAGAAMGSAVKMEGSAVIPSLLAELGTMTVAGKAVEGELPTGRDLLENALLLGGMHGVGHAVGEGMGQYAEMKKTQVMRNFYGALGDTGEASKLRARLPEAYQELVAKLTKDGPLENIFIAPERLQEYFQSKGLDTDQVTQDLGVSDSYNEAKTTGRDVQIPLDTWAKNFVGTEHFQGLADDIKFSPDDLSVRESEARKSAIQDQMRAIDQGVLPEPSEADAATAKSSAELQESLEKQLKDAGMSATEARHNAKIHEAFFRSTGNALGVEPKELADRFPLEVGNSDAPTEAGSGDLAAQNQEHEQGAAADISQARGRIRISPTGYNIDLLKNADRSTFLHESGHYFLEVLGKMAEGENAPAGIKDDYATLLKWFGVDSKDQIGSEHHEKFARGFESYLMEGKAPSQALASTFSRFRRWLTAIYKNIKNLKVELPPEVREVMDRMLATDDEIQAANHASGYRAEHLPDLPPEMQAKIADLQDRAREIAESTLMKEQMKEIKAGKGEFLAEQRERLTEEAREQVSQDPLYKAIDDLKNHEHNDVTARANKFLKAAEKGEGADADFEVTAQTHGFDNGQELASRISLAAKEGLFNAQVKARVDAGMAKYEDMRNTDVIQAEALKAIHNGKMTELLALEREALAGLVHQAEVKLEAKKRNQAEAQSERAAEEAVAAKEKDETKRAALVEKIKAKFEARFKAEAAREIAPEIARRKRVEAKIEAQAAQEEAKAILGAKPIKDATNARSYVTSERNAAVKAAQAIAKGDYERAAEFKRQQMLNHALAAEAIRNFGEAQKSIAYLSEFAKRGNDMMKMPLGFIHQVDGLMSRFGFADPRPQDLPTLTEIATQMAARNETPYEIADATGLKLSATQAWAPETLPEFVTRVNDNYHAMSLPDVVLSGGRRAYEDLTLSELRDLKDATKTIATLGKNSDRFLGDLIEKAGVSAAGKELRASVAENFGTPFAKDLLPGSSHETKLSENLANLASVPATFDRNLDNMLTTCDKLDGLKEGPAKEYIYRPLKEAEDRKMARVGEKMKEVDAIFAKHYAPKELQSYKETRVNIDGRYFTKEQLLCMGLNWGNEGNRQRLMTGFGFDEAKMNRIFKENLGAKDWAFIQDTWDHLQKYWPESAKLEMDVNGVEPRGVQPAPFENEHGKFAGGYYPIAYDAEKSSEAYRNTEQKSALYKQFSTAKAATEQGHLQARTASVNRQLTLSLDVLPIHHENMIHDLEYRKAIIDVSRFLANKDAKAALMDGLGVKGYAAINDWVKAAADNGGESVKGLDKIARWFRFNSTMVNMAFRIGMAPKIFAENVINLSSERGMSGAARALGSYWFGDGSRLFGDGSSSHATIVGKSEFMKQRATHMDRDLGDIVDKHRGDQGLLVKSGAAQFAFITHSLADQAISFPLWSDTYQKGMASHGDEKLAINQADESVKRTFMSGGKLDQPAIMRGGEGQKALTVAYGYQSMMYNRWSRDRFKVSQAWGAGNHTVAVALAARSFLYTFAMPALVGTLSDAITHNVLGGSDDDDKNGVVKFLEEATPLKFIPILRDVAPYLIKKAMGEHGSGLHLSPMEHALTTIADPLADIGMKVFAGKQLPSQFPMELADAAGFVAGCPKQVNDMIFNFADWMEGHGELTWKDAIARRTKK